MYVQNILNLNGFGIEWIERFDHIWTWRRYHQQSVILSSILSGLWSNYLATKILKAIVCYLVYHSFINNISFLLTVELVIHNELYIWNMYSLQLELSKTIPCSNMSRTFKTRLIVQIFRKIIQSSSLFAIESVLGMVQCPEEVENWYNLYSVF